jgi:hypothetical protein
MAPRSVTTSKPRWTASTSPRSEDRLILDHEVTNDVTDQGHLSSMGKRAKEILRVKKFDLVADMGYYDGQGAAACVEAGIQPWISKPHTSANHKKGLYTKDDFSYDKRRDCYLCPAGERLEFRFTSHFDDRDVRYYATAACGGCQVRSLCTTNTAVRRITRSEEEWFLDDMELRNRMHPEKIKSRQEVVEHPFGTIKRSMNQGFFLMRGLQKVKTEMSLTVLAYNMKRVFNIFGVTQMVQPVLAGRARGPCLNHFYFSANPVCFLTQALRLLGRTAPSDEKMATT